MSVVTSDLVRMVRSSLTASTALRNVAFCASDSWSKIPAETKRSVLRVCIMSLKLTEKRVGWSFWRSGWTRLNGLTKMTLTTPHKWNCCLSEKLCTHLFVRTWVYACFEQFSCTFFAFLHFCIFYRTRVRSLVMLVTNWLTHSLTHWLTHCRLVNFLMWAWHVKMATQNLLKLLF